MTQTISRLYDKLDAAAQAKAALEANDYAEVHLVASDGSRRTHDDIVAAITSGKVLKAHAEVYAKQVLSGLSLVTVHAPFSGGALAEEIVDGFKPVDRGIVKPFKRPAGWDDRTPVSSVLHMPLLLPDDATFAKFWNLPPLASSALSFSKRIGAPLLTSANWFFSASYMPLLNHQPTPLSSQLGLPLLGGNKLSSMLGIPMLMDKMYRLPEKWMMLSNVLRLPMLTGPSWLPSATALPLLSDEPAPLSTRLNLPQVVSNPAPLSSRLGLPVSL